MRVTVDDAQNHFGRVLDAASRRPVVVEKAGRRHSVILSAEQYDALVAAKATAATDEPDPPRTAEEFYARYKDWVDKQNARFERIGIWNEEFRTW